MPSLPACPGGKVITIDSRSVRDRVTIVASEFGAGDYLAVDKFMRKHGVMGRKTDTGTGVWNTDHEVSAMLKYEMLQPGWVAS